MFYCVMGQTFQSENLFVDVGEKETSLFQILYFVAENLLHPAGDIPRLAKAFYMRNGNS